jgi:peptidoglycan hydrolase-like protein with peptidoglycan-binding domain
VFQDRLVPGQDDSDSVRRLQRVLNEWSFVGGQELPITGFYGPDTQHEVALFQEQICGDPPDGAIGPKQTDVLFEKLGPWNIIR